MVPQYIYTCINLPHNIGVAEWIGSGHFIWQVLLYMILLIIYFKKNPNCTQQLIPNLCMPGLIADCPLTLSFHPMQGHLNFQNIAIHTLNYLNYNIKPATSKSTGFFNIRNSPLVYTFVNIHQISVSIRWNLLTCTQNILFVSTIFSENYLHQYF